MNIFRNSFNQAFPFISSTLSRCNFIAIDLQMSGMKIQSKLLPSYFDTPQIRYQKAISSVKRNLPIQIGLCGLQVTNSQIIAYPFNFYLNAFAVEEELLQATFNVSTIRFLTKNNFDFNKLYYEGLPFVCKQKLKQIQGAKIEENLYKRLKKSKLIESPQSIVFVNHYLPKIQQWLFSKSEESLQIPIEYMKVKCYHLLIHRVREKYDQLGISFTFDHKQFFKKTKLILSRKAFIQNSFKDLNLFSQQKMFNQILDFISQSKKAIIVHNGMYDLLHIYNRFFASLPNTYSKYLQEMHKIFPLIYDTKFISQTSPLLFNGNLQKQTNLIQSYRVLRQKTVNQQVNSLSENQIQFKIDSEFKDYELESDKNHQAGFDALMTGYNFIKIFNILGLSLQDFKTKTFHQKQSRTRNRVCFINPKIGVNFQIIQHDSYLLTSEPLYFKSILNNRTNQQKIRQALQSTYGAINFGWKNINNIEFCVLFHSSDMKKQFMIDHNINELGLNIVTVDDQPFLVLTHEKQIQFIKNSSSLLQH